MHSRALPVFLFVACLLSSCGQEKDEPVLRVIGEAYAGPNQLAIRQDLSLRSPVVTEIPHGEKLEVLERRRRFVQVRTKKKQVGWVDMRLLISERQRREIDEMAERYKAVPSMGTATVFDILNVHTETNRGSPTFLQIEEKERVAIIGHRIVERKPYTGELLDIEDSSATKAPVKKKKSRREPRIEPPPAPPAPGLPPNWLELSKTAAPVPEPAVEVLAPVGKKGKKKAVSYPPPAVPMDDFTLIRTKSGRVGWVLTSPLFLEVPDDVAQYAEGHRITSYFSMGEVQDGAVTKKHWLWTTKGEKHAPYDFDGIRLFTYNARRHRYETAYREREVRGYFPATVDLSKSQPEFRLIVQDEAGKMWRRLYAFDGVRARMVNKEPYQAPLIGSVAGTKPDEAPKGEPGIWDRLKGMLPGK